MIIYYRIFEFFFIKKGKMALILKKIYELIKSLKKYLDKIFEKKLQINLW